MSKLNRETDYSTVMDLGHASGLIRYINDHGEVNLTDLRFIIPTYDRLKRTMDRLFEAGLVDRKHIESPRITFKYWLTDKGKKVAEKLTEINEILS